MRFKALATLGIAVTLILGLALPAAAASKTFTDPAGDPIGSSTTAGANLDLRTVKVTYTKKKLTVVAGFTALKKASWTSANLVLDVDGDGFLDARANAQNAKGTISADYLAPGSATPVKIKVTQKKKKVTFAIPAGKLAIPGKPKPKSVAVNINFDKSSKKGSLAADWAPNGAGTSPYSPPFMPAVKRG